MADVRDLLTLMARLRDPDQGCPWDRQQSFATIVPYTLEEAYEVADAIEREAWDELRAELGDLLFQVVFYAQMAKEQGWFDFQQVVDGIVEKMTRRHPHVFGDAEVRDAAHQTEAWERHKAAEREAAGASTALLDAVPIALPATVRAQKLQKKAAKVGFDWPDASGVLEKIAEEVDEVRVELEQQAPQERVEAEIGDLLFACVNLARTAGVDAESALRGAGRRFYQRFGYIENALQAQGRSPAESSLDEMETLWQEAKRRLAQEQD